MPEKQETKFKDLDVSLGVMDLCDLVEEGVVRVRFADRPDVVLKLKDASVEDLEVLAKVAEDAADELEADAEESEDAEEDESEFDDDDDDDDDDEEDIDPDESGEMEPEKDERE